MSRKFLVLLSLPVLLVAAGLTGKYWLGGALQLAGITRLDYQLESASWHHLAIRELHLVYQAESSASTVDIKGLQLQWDWLGWLLPQPSQLQVNKLVATLGETTAAAEEQPAAWLLPERWELPGWLPANIRLSRFELYYPCKAAATCQFKGQLLLTLADQHIELTASGHSVPAWPGQHYELAASYRLDSGKLRGSATVLEPVLPENMLAAGLNITALTANIDGSTLVRDARLSLPLQVTLTSTGSTGLQLLGDLEVYPDSGEIIIKRGSLGVIQPELQAIDSVRAQQLAINSQFSGTASAAAVELQLEFNSRIASLCQQGNCISNIELAFPQVRASLQEASGEWQVGTGQTSRYAVINGELHMAALPATEFRLTLKQLNAANSDGQLQFLANTELVLPKLAYPGLHPLQWQWQAQWQGMATQLSGQGRIDNAGGLALDYQLGLTGNDLRLDWQLQDIFLRAGNPLTTTAADWPELATASSGKVTASGNVTLNLNRPGAIEATAKLSLEDIQAIYDTTAIKGLQANATLQLHGEQLLASTDDLQIAEINPGMALGPLRLQASYQATTSAPANGQLKLQTLQLQAFGGELTLQPTSWQLDEELATTLTVADVQLNRLLDQYPSSVIKGTGTLAGSLPIRYSNGSFAVNAGSLAASEQGGVLQYVSPDAARLAASNQGMGLLVNTLADFHYDVLSSKVNYDESGKLLLALRLQGSNPAVENGRVVNFNINLEENLPALFTSLQLSDKVSDIVRKRVEQRVRQQQYQSPSSQPAP